MIVYNKIQFYMGQSYLQHNLFLNINKYKNFKIQEYTIYQGAIIERFFVVDKEKKK